MEIINIMRLFTSFYSFMRTKSYDLSYTSIAKWTCEAWTSRIFLKIVHYFFKFVIFSKFYLSIFIKNKENLYSLLSFYKYPRTKLSYLISDKLK